MFRKEKAPKVASIPPHPARILGGVMLKGLIVWSWRRTLTPPPERVVISLPLTIRGEDISMIAPFRLRFAIVGLLIISPAIMLAIRLLPRIVKIIVLVGKISL